MLDARCSRVVAQFRSTEPFTRFHHSEPGKAWLIQVNDSRQSCLRFASQMGPSDPGGLGNRIGTGPRKARVAEYEMQRSLGQQPNPPRQSLGHSGPAPVFRAPAPVEEPRVVWRRCSPPSYLRTTPTSGQTQWASQVPPSTPVATPAVSAQSPIPRAPSPEWTQQHPRPEVAAEASDRSTA